MWVMFTETRCIAGELPAVNTELFVLPAGSLWQRDRTYCAAGETMTGVGVRRGGLALRGSSRPIKRSRSVPNFVAFFPSKEAAQPPTAAFSALERIFRAPLRADDVRTNVLRGATLLRTRSAGMSPRFYASEDGAGWIVVKGQIFDVRSETPLVDLEELLQRFLTEDLAILNRYEGTFALAAWDARRGQGWALND
jgi:hypothetical protein